MVATVFAAKGNGKSAEVVCVSKDDLSSPGKRRRICYVTTSEGKLFTCTSADTCIRDAKAEIK